MATYLLVNTGSNNGLLSDVTEAITWVNVEFSLMRFCGILPTAISQQMPKLTSLKSILLGLLPHLPGANELTMRDLHGYQNADNICNIYTL